MERRVGALIGLPTENFIDRARVKYFQLSTEDCGLQLINNCFLFQDPYHPAPINFLISVLPSEDPMSNMITGYALGAHIPTLILTTGEMDQKLPNLPGQLIMPIDALTRQRVDSAVKRFALWMDDEEDSRLLNGPRFFRNGPLQIDYSGHVVAVHDQEVNLSPIEFKITDILARNVDRALSKDQLLEGVWGDDFKGYHHILRVNVCRIRNKIEESPVQPKLIVTMAGFGYKMPSIDIS